MDKQQTQTLRRLMEYEANRKAPPEGFPELPDIPGGRYTDPRFFALEQQYIWRKSWLLAGHIDDFEGSLVHKLTELIAGKGTDAATRDLRQVEFRRLCDMPTAFIAQIEAKTGMRKDMLASFGDVQ